MLDDRRALNPAVTDWRGLLASLPGEADRADAAGQDGPPPALAQVWAQGFHLFAVDRWADDWAPPRDKEIAASMADALDCDGGPAGRRHRHAGPEPVRPDGPPSTSEARFEPGAGAVGSLRPLRHRPQPGPAHGAGAPRGQGGPQRPVPVRQRQKFKKCHGA
ncbi:MAG: hypothetical protein R3F09_17735 [Burkholderiaceae bacterium]